MGEVRTDDEEILFGEIRLEDRSNVLEHTEAFGPDHDGHYRRDILEDHLQEWQLDFEAMLAVVGVPPADEHTVSILNELLPEGYVYRNVAKRRPGERIQRIHACAREAHPVAGPKEENPLV